MKKTYCQTKMIMLQSYCSYGEIAQLARAIGSYPIGRGFDPLSRYQIDYYSNFSSINKTTCQKVVFMLL